jgi:hypothetical protein
MADHDQRFKTLLREFFAEFMELFFPDRAALLDLTRVEWLDKELFLDPPQGEKRELDLVARVAAKSGEEEILLVHVEVESEDRTTGLDDRFAEYYRTLRRKYSQPVLPLAMFLKVGLDGLGERVIEEQVLGEWVHRFRYWYVGLPALEAERYIEDPRWLGAALSGLMRAACNTRARLMAEAQQKLVKYPDPTKRYYLVDCLQAYAQLSAADRIELASLLQLPEYSGAATMNKTVYEEGLEKGLERGPARGEGGRRRPGNAPRRRVGHPESIRLAERILAPSLGGVPGGQARRFADRRGGCVLLGGHSTRRLRAHRLNGRSLNRGEHESNIVRRRVQEGPQNDGG